MSHVTETCEQYVDVLVTPSSVTSESGGDDSVARARWRDELANRRQLASYLSTMTDDLREDKQELDAAVTGFRCVAELCFAERLDITEWLQCGGGGGCVMYNVGAHCLVHCGVVQDGAGRSEAASGRPFVSC